jgi:hypothetical protein
MTNCHLILVRPMRAAFRILIVAYILAGVAWAIALFPRLVVHGGDLGTAMISPMAEAKTRKNTFFAWISIKQMNELA